MSRHVFAAALLALAAAGCVLDPEGADSERDRLAAAGAPWRAPVEERALPELPLAPGWRDVLQRAFLSNGELEAAWQEWAAAVARIDVAAAWPNTNVSLGVQYLFSDEHMKSWDRTTLSVGFDPMQNLELPSKVEAAGRVALDEARAAGERFAERKFELQRRVLEAWLDAALLAERIRLAQQDAELSRLLAVTAGARVQAGGGQDALLQSSVDSARKGNELASLQAERPAAQARLNALMGRTADAPLALPAELPAPRPLGADDATLLALGVQGQPELAALAHEVAGRGDALEVARLRSLPDINPFAMVTGSVEQVVGAAVSLPTTWPALRGAVAEAQANLAASRAALRQARLDRGAEYVAMLAALRSAERQSALLARDVLPLAERAVGNLRQSYATGAAGLDQLLDGERAVLDVRRLAAEARIAREQSLAELEALAGIDFETLQSASAATRGTEGAHDE